MRNEKEVIGKAAELKIGLVSRGRQIMELSTLSARARAGLAPDIKPDRLETIEAQLGSLGFKQMRDSLCFATLRWALGITEDIDANKLELDK
jgi:hypothetical protein